MIDDSSYRQMAVVRAANGLSADLHEFRLTPQGTALITAYYPVYWDATAVTWRRTRSCSTRSSRRSTSRPGLVLFQWDSLDHVPLTDSYEPCRKSAGTPFDYFHVNSVDSTSDGKLAHLGPQHLGRLQGRPRNRRDHLDARRQALELQARAGVQFAFQHDVLVHTDSDMTVTLFDDGAGPPRVHYQSRGITVRLNGEHQDRDARGRGRARARHSPRASKATSRSSPAATTSSAGASSRTSASSTRRARWCSTAGSSATTRATAPTASRGPARPRRRRGRASSERHEHGRLRQLERRHRGERVAGAGRHARVPCKLWRPRRSRASRARSRFRQRYVAVQALDSAGRVLGTSTVVRAS